MEYRLTKEHFLRGITNNPETGFETMKGIDLYGDLGFMTPAKQGMPVSTTMVDATVTNIIIDNESARGVSIGLVVFADKVVRYNIDANTFSSTPTGSQKDSGSAYMKNWLYLADSYNSTLAKLNIKSTGLGRYVTGVMTLQAGTDRHEMMRFKDQVYGCNFDRIFSITDSLTNNASALLLESHTCARSITPYGDYLAIGAVRGYYQPMNYGTGAGEGTYMSKLYFWDTFSSTWDKDRSTDINGVILKVLNDRGILKVWVKRETDRIDILYFDGNSLQPLETIVPNQGSNIIAPSGGAFDIKNNMVYFGAGYTNKGGFTVYGYGTGDMRISPAVSTPYEYDFAGVTTLKSFDSLKWIKDNQLWAGVTSMGDTHYLYKFGTASTEYAFEIKTPIFSFPRKQIVNSIRVNCKPLTSGDQLYLYRKVDYGSWDATNWNTAGYFTNSSSELTSIVFPTKQFLARTLQLKFTQGESDNIRIKEIIVNTEDIDEI